MSFTSIPRPVAPPLAEDAITALAQALAVAELLALHCGERRFESAFSVLIDLISQATRLVMAINSEGAQR